MFYLHSHPMPELCLYEGEFMFFSWSETGIYHKNNNEVNQDVIITDENQDMMLAILCDGVSSCKYAKEGAEIAGSSAAIFLSNKYRKLIKYDKRMIAEKTINHVRYDLNKEAKSMDRDVNEYSSTISAVLYDRDEAKLLCVNVGDAIVGALTEDGIEIIEKPQRGYKGCYVTTTKDATQVTDVSVIDADKYKSVFICTDGMWKAFYDGKNISSDIAEKIKGEAFDEMVDAMKCNPEMDDRSMVVMKLRG